MASQGVDRERSRAEPRVSCVRRPRGDALCRRHGYKRHVALISCRLERGSTRILPKQPESGGSLFVRPHIYSHELTLSRATDSRSCADCHAVPGGDDWSTGLLKNVAVRPLMKKAEGTYRPAAFAHCLRCRRAHSRPRP